MKDPTRWTAAAKAGTAAIVGILLTVGLCKAGTPFMSSGTPLRDGLQTAGLVTFIVTVVCVVVCILFASRDAIDRIRK